MSPWFPVGSTFVCAGLIGIGERREFALTLTIGGFFAVVGGLAYADDRPALAVLHLSVGLIVVILARVRYDAIGHPSGERAVLF